MDVDLHEWFDAVKTFAEEDVPLWVWPLAILTCNVCCYLTGIYCSRRRSQSHDRQQQSRQRRSCLCRIKAGDHVPLIAGTEIDGDIELGPTAVSSLPQGKEQENKGTPPGGEPRDAELDAKSCVVTVNPLHGRSVAPPSEPKQAPAPQPEQTHDVFWTPPPPPAKRRRLTLYPSPVSSGRYVDTHRETPKAQQSSHATPKAVMHWDAQRSAVTGGGASVSHETTHKHTDTQTSPWAPVQEVKPVPEPFVPPRIVTHNPWTSSGSGSGSGSGSEIVASYPVAVQAPSVLDEDPWTTETGSWAVVPPAPWSVSDSTPQSWGGMGSVAEENILPPPPLVRSDCNYVPPSLHTDVAAAQALVSVRREPNALSLLDFDTDSTGTGLETETGMETETETDDDMPDLELAGIPPTPTRRPTFPYLPYASSSESDDTASSSSEGEAHVMTREELRQSAASIVERVLAAQRQNIEYHGADNTTTAPAPAPAVSSADVQDVDTEYSYSTDFEQDEEELASEPSPRQVVMQRSVDNLQLRAPQRRIFLD